MKIKTAFSLLILSGIIILTGTVILLTKSIDLIEKDATYIRQFDDRVQIAEELENILRNHNREAFLYLLTKKQEHLAMRKEARTELNQLLIALKQNISNPEKEKLIDDIVAEVNNYFKFRTQIDRAHISPSKAYISVVTSIDRISILVDSLVNLNALEVKKLKSDIDERNHSAKLEGVILVLVSAGLLLFSLVLSIQFVYRPLKSLGEGLRTFGLGNLDFRLNPEGLKDIRDLAISYNDIAEQLGQRKQDQLRFLAAVAHDLRNPLASILMSIDLLIAKDAGSKNTSDIHLLEIIERQLKNLDRQVGDLLDSTRIEAGQLELQISKCNLNSILIDSIEMYQQSSKTHQLMLNLPEKEISIHCDATRISQVINNLISNAIKYSPNGGTIEIKAFQEPNSVVISVADHGIGVSPFEVDQIFQPFNRSLSTKNTTPGIGLGLSSSRRILQKLGGSIYFESRPEGGSIFFVALPTS